ncbi:DUF917 domain-containing protein [Nonomuraea lactucae]|uniref:DUF917 domain-containing protein n=1 Tax=Nonomuraea lactucae TaxID=2249762 RepID=UPI000DE30EC0|nr:DUF917 domain-containing protein [Nonomuraea lactucae]
MNRLDATALRDIARGSSVLAGGGGGDPFRGTLSAIEMTRQYGPPKVITIGELPDDAIVACPFIIGAPLAFLEKFPFGDELAVAARELERVIGAPIAALLPAEIGGINSTLPLALGARMNIPVIDADTMGRAYPEMDMTLLNVEGIPAAPTVVADEHGNRVVVHATSNVWTETLARTVSVKFGAAAAGIGYSATVARLRHAVIEGSLSNVRAIGRAMREAAGDPERVIASITELTDAVELFRGKIVDLNREIVDGFVRGTVLLDGAGPDAGSRMAIDIQNEYLVARRDGSVVASAPDIVTVMDAASGLPLTTESLRYGYRLVVLGIACNERWRTEAGLAVGGPARLGYDFPYVPLEQHATARARGPIGAWSTA